MTERSWWRASVTLSIIFAFLLTAMWFWIDRTDETNPDQLVDQGHVDKYLQTHLPETEDPTQIPTGIFLQSFKFNNSSEVNLTGYIWQRYDKDVPDKERGFVFPEAVDSGSNIKPTKTYRYESGDEKEVIGWYFEVTLRQRFEYNKYPLDHKTVWIRLWHKNFSGKSILTPDLSAYRSTQLKDTFGIDKDIVFGGWNINKTFFNYNLPGDLFRLKPRDGILEDLKAKKIPEALRKAFEKKGIKPTKIRKVATQKEGDSVWQIDGNENGTGKFPYFVYAVYKKDGKALDHLKAFPGYNTDFGAGTGNIKMPFPELYFNIVIKRKFRNAFIIHLVPLFVVAGLLFATLMIVSKDEDRKRTFGFSTSGVLGACSGLFFVVLLAHIQLRQQFAGAGIVYVEYFYLLMYLTILAVGLNTYLFSAGIARMGLIHDRDNLIPKLVFWPLLLGLVVIITLLVFFI